MKKPIIVFTHIPKTAGSTINSVLSFQYGHAHSYWYSDQTECADVLPAFLGLKSRGTQDLNLIRGHFAYGIHEKIELDCKYISFLRDPVARVISFYHYAKKCEGMYWGEVASPYSSILEFIRSTDTRLVDNLQVRYLSGLNPNYGCCNQGMLDLAKQNIENNFIFVGLAEKFDASLVVLSDLLKWERPLFYLKAMVNRSRPAVEEGAQTLYDEIRERNKYDIELYEWVRDRFDRQFDLRKEYYERRIKKMQRYNKLACWLVPFPLKIYRKLRR